MTDDRPCPDHFVGTETLRCHTCGYNAATLTYEREQTMTDTLTERAENWREYVERHGHNWWTADEATAIITALLQENDS